MPSAMQGHYAPIDVLWSAEHDGTTLNEIVESGISWDTAFTIEPAGAGLGVLKNFYYKTVAPPKGTFKIDRALLQRSDKGMLFLDLATGAKVVQQEAIAAAAASYTVNLATALVSILEVRLNTSLVILREGLDYTVNYVTGVVTFTAVLPEAATIRYLASSRKLQNFLINGGFEDAITNIWIGFGTGTVARNTANAYVEGNALAVTPAAINDGVQYNISTNLQPGRQYRVRGWAKAAAAEVLAGFWFDGTTDQAMAVVSGATLTTVFTPFEFTFTPTKAIVPNLKIKDTKASPALFYIDQLQLLDDTTATNPTVGGNIMDQGLSTPFTFNLVGKRMWDGVVVHKLMKCAINKIGNKSGKQYAETVDGMFLEYITE